MGNWQYLLLGAAGIFLVTAAIVSGICRSRARRERDFTRSLETLLQPRETVKVICPQKGFRCILTNSRIILEKRGKFTAFPLRSVRKLQGSSKEGNRTTVPARMVTLTVKLEQDVILRNTGDAFLEAAKFLQEKVKKQNEKKKPDKKS